LKIQPSADHTMCAIGQYTSSSQSEMKTTKALNFMRSATAPRISAGVMIANMAWNITKISSGIWRGGDAKFATVASGETLTRPSFEKSPMKLPPVPKARL
jgi:hypothetical protein